MPQDIQESLGKLLTFICEITPQQIEVLIEMQRTDFSGPEPERAARGVYDSAMRAGIRSSVIHMIVKHHLTTRGIAFNKGVLNNHREMARRSWENVGTQQHPPPPPLVLDPRFKRNPDNQR